MKCSLFRSNQLKIGVAEVNVLLIYFSVTLVFLKDSLKASSVVMDKDKIENVNQH